jgi:IS30 family transposase
VAITSSQTGAFTSAPSPLLPRSGFVQSALAEGWTPEQISGWLKSGNEPRLRAIGCETIYATNLTPRKCLGFKTPFQALLAELGKDVQIRFS